MNHYEAKQEARRARLEARAEKMAIEGNARIAKARDMASIIPFGQPILVGHHSEKRDRNYRGKIHNNFAKGYETLKAAGEVAARADSVGTGGISSDDPEAVAKLKEQLAQAEAMQVKMIAANKLVRKGNLEALAALVGEKVAAALMQPGMVGGQGYASFQLTNNGANIRRIKVRISQLEKSAGREHKEILHNSGVKIVQNVEANRIQLIFPGKPEAKMREMLKAHGFRWAPSEGAWQRHLNNAGVYATKCVMRELTKEASD